MGEGQGEGMNSDRRGKGQGLSGRSFCLPGHSFRATAGAKAGA
jgi:hypothetical protein